MRKLYFNNVRNAAAGKFIHRLHPAKDSRKVFIYSMNAVISDSRVPDIREAQARDLTKRQMKQ